MLEPLERTMMISLMTEIHLAECEHLSSTFRVIMTKDLAIIHIHDSICFEFIIVLGSFTELHKYIISILTQLVVHSTIRFYTYFDICLVSFRESFMVSKTGI